MAIINELAGKQYKPIAIPAKAPITAPPVTVCLRGLFIDKNSSLKQERPDLHALVNQQFKHECMPKYQSSAVYTHDSQPERHNSNTLTYPCFQPEVTIGIVKIAPGKQPLTVKQRNLNFPCQRW
jgi:hypothetical protein